MQNITQGYKMLILFFDVEHIYLLKKKKTTRNLSAPVPV